MIEKGNSYIFYMDKLNTKYFTNREQWRKWLEMHFDKEKEIWLIFPKKSSGKNRILYNDAVEEALCFGWIDSIVKTYDEESSIQRFTPRKSESHYSQPNKERLKWLYKENKLNPSIREQVQDILKEAFVFPADIIDEIKKNKKAWEHYQAFSETYKRIRVAYIDTARNRPDEFSRRLGNFIKKTEKNKQIGFGGIEKYY
jgi:uncharacterized protein YdeI (YjbR/CyaY-like superfamily)